MTASLHRAFVVQIKEGSRIVHEFGDTGPDSLTVAARHQASAEAGQFVRVTPVKAEPFPVAVVRNELETVELRNSPAAIRAREFHLANDAQAMAIQMQHLDAMRRAGL